MRGVVGICPYTGFQPRSVKKGPISAFTIGFPEQREIESQTAMTSYVAEEGEE